MKWLQNYGFSFPLLIDRERVFYRQVGLRRFLKNTFCVKNFKYYADEVCAGLLTDDAPYSGTDFSVMGGDFVLDSSGKLLYAYHCKDQFDRPEIETLLDFLQGTN